MYLVFPGILRLEHHTCQEEMLAIIIGKPDGFSAIVPKQIW